MVPGVDEWHGSPNTSKIEGPFHNFPEIDRRPGNHAFPHQVVEKQHITKILMCVLNIVAYHTTFSDNYTNVNGKWVRGSRIHFSSMQPERWSQYIQEETSWVLLTMSKFSARAATKLQQQRSVSAFVLMIFNPLIQIHIAEMFTLQPWTLTNLISIRILFFYKTIVTVKVVKLLCQWLPLNSGATAVSVTPKDPEPNSRQ